MKKITSTSKPLRNQVQMPARKGQSSIQTLALSPVLPSRMKFVEHLETTHLSTNFGNTLAKESITFNNLYELLLEVVGKCIPTDIKWCIGSEVFSCHKTILFSLTDGFDTFEDLVKKLPADEIAINGFKLVSDWIWCKCLEVRKSGIFDFCCVVDALKIVDLQYQCWKFLDSIKEWDFERPLTLQLTPPKLGLGDVLRKILQSELAIYFLYIVASDKFINLSFEEIVLLLSHNALAVNTELEIFLAGIRWLTAKWPERQVFAVEVMRCVRFSQLTFSICNLLKDYCREVHLVTANQSVKKLFFSNEIADKRKWIVDRRCQYHRCDKCSRKKGMPVTYYNFIDYLKILKTNGPDFSNQIPHSNPKKISWKCCKCPN